MLEVVIARGCRPTGELLIGLLRERGVQIGAMRPDARVSWGRYIENTSIPTLNRYARAQDKYVELVTIHDAGILTPAIYTPDIAATKRQDTFPLLARLRNHHGGIDIRVVLQPEYVPIYVNQGWDFFTQFIPKNREYRVWVYRRRHLGTYEKVLVRPQEFTRLGSNHANGFAFRLVTAEAVPRPAVEAAINAVEALKLDFGAVDVLLGKDGRFYALEANTAPGAEDEGRFAIRNLADKIARWVQLGYPRRNGDRQ